MTMNLKMTRRTWYALLLTAAACSLLAGFAAFAGQQLGLLDQLAFGATALAALFLAAEKGSPKQEKTGYFGVFVLLMLAYVAGAPLAHLFGAAVWPLLLAVERRRGMPVAQPLRLVCFAEAAHLLLLLLALAGFHAAFFTNLLWLLTAAARGAAALQLYRAAAPAED